MGRQLFKAFSPRNGHDVSGEARAPKGESDGGQFIASVRAAMKPATTQKRAMAGGEVGKNGADYKGGQFIATTADVVKGATRKVKAEGDRLLGRKEEVEPYKWIPLPLGQAPLRREFMAMVSYSYDKSRVTLTEAPVAALERGYHHGGGRRDNSDWVHDPDIRSKLTRVVDRWNKGERIIDLHKHPASVVYGDIAKYVAASKAIPKAFLSAAKKAIPDVDWKKYNSLLSEDSEAPRVPVVYKTKPYKAPPPPKTVNIDMPMPFGKHKGVPISSVPKAYLAWVHENMDLESSPGVKAAIAKVCEKKK